MSDLEQTSTTQDLSAEMTDAVNKGLAQFYSSLAASAQAQYDNILHLLGQTSDWTAPGMACEVLIRQLIRNMLPTQFSVDKGFIYGRRLTNEGQNRHSPEIDILIHDSHNYAPLLRIEDFVIVQPAAVRGIVQVKRTMTSKTLKNALQNIVEAKRHIQDCKQRAYHLVKLENVFSAFIAFRDDINDPKTGGMSTTYENRIKEHFQVFRDGNILPHFVGSLDSRVFGFTGLSHEQMGYIAYNCVHKTSDGQQQHMGLQVFLSMMAQSILPRDAQPPFAFPADYIGGDSFILFKAEPKEEQVAQELTTCASAVESNKPIE